jgi:outer membrane biosynthesis protein TonB
MADDQELTPAPQHGHCRVVVRTIDSGSFTIDVDVNEADVVNVVKAKLEELSGIGRDRQRLLHRGRELVDSGEATAQSLGWGDHVVLHMVTRPAGPEAGAGGQQQEQQQQGNTTVFQMGGGGPLPPEVAQTITSFMESMARGGMNGNGDGDDESMGQMLQDMLSQGGHVSDPIGGSLLSGRVPPLNDDGTLRLGSAFEVLHNMLTRLEHGNMEEDRVPSMQETSLEMFRDVHYRREFAAAVTEFLQACRNILRGCTLNRETREVVNRALRMAGQGPLPLGVEVESFPVMDASGDEDEDGERDNSWIADINHEDLIVVAAVAVGELARRLMGILGQLESPTGMYATVLRVAERLRSMSSVGNHEETVAQIRLVVGHLSRVAVSSAELGRAMAYLTSALSDTNMFFLQLYPGYIQMQNGLPRPNLGILHNLEAHRVVTMVPEVSGMPQGTSIAGIMSMQLPVPMSPGGGQENNNNASEGQGQRSGTNNAVRTQVRVHTHAIPIAIGPRGMRPPPPPSQQQQQSGDQAANQQQGGVRSSSAEEILRAIPQVDQILNSLGGAQGGQGLADVFSNALRGIASSNVTIESILNEIKDAISQGISAAASQIRSASGDATPSLDQIVNTAVPEITSRVGNVLRERITTVMNASNAPASAPEEPVSSEAAPAAQQAPQEPQGPEAPEQDTPSVEPLPEQQKEEKNNEPSTSSQKKSAKPAGLGGGLKRRKVTDKPTGQAGRNAPAAPNLPQRSTSSSRGPASGSSMQNLLGQMMSGGSSGGPSSGGMDFGALLNSAGPLLGQMMGGRSASQEAPLDVDEVLESEISSEEERLRWKAHIERMAALSKNGHTNQPLSEAYLASIPSGSGGQGILDAIFGDE